MTNTTPSSSTTLSSQGSSAHTQMKHKYLSNGCECYLEPVDFAPLVSLQMWVRTGSLDEQAHEFGMAHVLEHMLFKGTERFPKTGEIAQQVEAAGGEINAYTTFDHTVYYINAPRDFAFQGAELLFDVVGSSLLDAGELSRELEVVIEEIRRSRDNPSARLSHGLFAKIYAGHPKARPVIGYEDVVRTFNRENLMAFYKRWYIPNNMFFVAAGDFQLEEMESWLETLAKRFPPGSLPQRVWSKEHASALKNQAPQIEVIHGPYQETRLQLSVTAPCLEEEVTPAWDMFASILGHGDSSRLAHAVKDEGQYVTAIDSSLYTPRFPYGFAGFGFYARSETAREALTASILEVSRLAKEGPTESELRRVLTAAKAERIYARESVEGLVRTVGGSLMTTAKLEFDQRYLAALGKVTLTQVQHCAQYFCDELSAGRVVCVAASNQDHAEVINPESLKATLEDAARSLGLGQTGLSSNCGSRASSFAVMREVSKRNANIIHHRVDLAPQARLHFNTRPSKRLPVASHTLVWRWGQHQEPAEKSGLNAVLAQMLTRGTTRQNYRSFVGELEDLGASVSAFSSRDLFGLRMDALSDVQPRVLKMLLDCMARPAFAADQFERIIRETEEVLVAQKDSPGSRLSRLTGPLYFADHPYGRPSLGTLETIRSITLDDVVMQWQRLLLTDHFVFSGAGDFNSDATLDAVAEELASIAQMHSARSSAVPPLASALNAPAQRSHGRIAFDVLDREQAHISLGVRGYTLDDPRRTALEVACAILGGQGGRLFMDLRDAQSLAYSVGCSQSPGLRGGTFSAYIGTAANKTQQAIAGLKRHIEIMATDEPSAEELSRAKNTLLGAQSLDSQHHHYQSSQLAMSDIYGLGYDNFLGFKDRLEAVTASDVSSAIRDLLKANAPCLAIVGPQHTWRPEETDELCVWFSSN